MILAFLKNNKDIFILFYFIITRILDITLTLFI